MVSVSDSFAYLWLNIAFFTANSLSETFIVPQKLLYLRIAYHPSRSLYSWMRWASSLRSSHNTGLCSRNPAISHNTQLLPRAFWNSSSALVSSMEDGITSFLSCLTTCRSVSLRAVPFLTSNLRLGSSNAFLPYLQLTTLVLSDILLSYSINSFFRVDDSICLYLCLVSGIMLRAV